MAQAKGPRRLNDSSSFDSDLTGKNRELRRQDPYLVRAPFFYARGAVIFSEGERAAGVFIIQSGKVKLSLGSREGKTAIVTVAGPGEIIGLTAAFSGEPHETTAMATEPVRAEFLRTNELLANMKNSEAISMAVARQLGSDCHRVYEEIRRLGFSSSVGERMARLVLQWMERPGSGGARTVTRLHVDFTHEEIAQFIGSTRETVTRLLQHLREARIISIEGKVWTITDRQALLALVPDRPPHAG